MDWRLSVDSAATTAFYDAREVGEAEVCAETVDCSGCANYVALRDQAFPDSVRRLLDELSIPYQKEIDSTDAGHPAKHLYHGLFYFAGRVLEGPSSQVPDGRGGHSIVLREVSETFEIGFSDFQSDGAGLAPQGSWVQIDFLTTLPWVLPESES